MKKDFIITIEKTGDQLYIATENSSGIKSYIEDEKSMMTCIENYIDIYVEDDQAQKVENPIAKDVETPVDQCIKWKLTIDGYENLDSFDQQHARGVISEAIETFNDFSGLFTIPKDEEKEEPRKCSHCGEEMFEGYCIDEGRFYYCSDECLYKNMTHEEYLELYDDGEGDSYYTQWDD
jgi:hypothetical protein